MGEVERIHHLVLGDDVPAGPITLILMAWSAEVNIWLSTTFADVVLSVIDPGETVDVIVNYAKNGWIPGETISARFIVGSSVIDGAFDEYIKITKGGRAIFFQ